MKTNFFRLSNIKNIFKDSMLSIIALVLMNLVLQFAVYPFWNRVYGNEVYGKIVYIMSFVNIFGVSVGSAVNYARMAESGKRHSNGSEYLTVAFAGGLFGLFITFLVSFYGKAQMDMCSSILGGMLCFFTVLRFYADIEFRLNINYRGYFVYYLLVSIGYIAGVVIVRFIGIWPLALIFGEIFGLLYVKIKGKSLSDKLFCHGEYIKENLGAMLLLILTNLISNLIFNGDRLLLMNIAGAGAVTTYYIASLVGKTMTLITTPLNSVFIGYLIRYKGVFSAKIIKGLFVISSLAIIIFSLLSIPGSYLIVYLLYRNELENVSRYFAIAGLSQVIYFVSNVVTTVLLRFAKVDYQLVINIAYGIIFFALCIPITYFYGINGFCIAILLVNISRYLLSIYLCYRSAK